jgi:hypothetical protein
MKHEEINVKRTNTMKQNLHLLTDRHLANDEISRLACNPELYYLVLKMSLVVPALSPINPFHIHNLHLHIHSKNIFALKPTPPELFLPFRFSDKR